MLKRIAVLVSASKHPISGAARYSHNDSLALQLALNLASKYAATVQVLHAGEADNPALQDYLALGASQIEVVSAAGNIVEKLAAQLNQLDLILTGTRAENAEDSGLLPYLLAAKLNLPIIAGALAINLQENPFRRNVLEVLQFLPKGQRRSILVSTPAIIAVHPLAPIVLHFAHARRSLGSIDVLTSKHLSYDARQWQLEAPRKPIKLKAQIKQTGHERLMDAISSKAKGGTVVNEGNSVEKAQVILRYLREHQLTKF